ncbi:MAG: GNAT family N-acetyltransferase [Anaerolineae bacterium]|nr:GNAT family N-acetyltransferase [Anaerolineae bacterium]MDW8099248.1 GNAT family N-acetyltransferase [Anaerolineae bacterium]
MIPPNVRLASADAADWDILAELQNQGFSEYPVSARITASEWRELLAAWDVDLSSSVLALTSSDQPVGMGWLGVRGPRGWIGGFAVAPGWRRRGIGRAMLGWLVEAARQRRLATVTLEVLTENAPAIALYQASSFRVQRELLTWERSPEMGSLPVPPMRAERADPWTLLSYFDAWHSEPPCWQQEQRSLLPQLEMYTGWVITRAGKPTAYALTNASSQQLELVDVGVAPGPEAVSAARTLLQSLQLLHMDYTLTFHHLPAGDPLNRVLAALGFQVILRLYEMRLDLSSW